MELATLTRTIKPARTMKLNAMKPSTAWTALSERSGASVNSLKVFANAYRDTAVSGQSVHSIFAPIGRTR